MSIRKLPDGRWIVYYRDNGKIKKEYFGRGIEAEHNAAARNAELNLREYHTAENPRPVATITFYDLANAYLQAKSIHLQPSTLSSMLYKLSSIIAPQIGSLPASKITPDVIDKFVRWRIDSGKTKSTVHRDITDIQAILNWGVRRGLIYRNPLAGYEKPKRDDAIIAPPSPAEVKKIISHAPDHLLRALTICYYTGLRPGASELLGITWLDIDFEGKTILIRSARKGGPRSRLIPLHAAFCRQLTEWHTLDGHDAEIIMYHGRPVASLKKSYSGAKRRAGIKRRLPLYSFRHAFATAVLAGGADLKATSEILGHSRPDTTIRIYQHTHPEMLRAVVNQLDELPDNLEN